MQVCTSFQTDNHASTPPLKSFLQAECPSCRPTNSAKALKALKNFPIFAVNNKGSAINDGLSGGALSVKILATDRSQLKKQSVQY